MTSRLLNSGKLSDYQAIGEDGVLVYQRADAFRTSIETAPSLGCRYSDHLAVPRFSTSGDHVDWFIPFNPVSGDGEYRIVSWNAASYEEKRKALAELEDLNSSLENYGNALSVRALTTNDRLLSHFMTGNKEADVVNPAIHFPDESCLFIVDGKPVITFWGFLNRGNSLKGQPFARLRTNLTNTAPSAVSKAGAVGSAATAVAPQSFLCAHKWCFLFLLLLLLLLPLLLYLLWWYFFARGLPLFKVYPDLTEGSLEPKITVDSDVIPDITGNDFGFDLNGYEVKLKDGSVVPYANGDLKDAESLADDGEVSQPLDNNLPDVSDNETSEDNNKIPEDNNESDPQEDNEGKDNADNQNPPVPPELSDDSQGSDGKDSESPEDKAGPVLSNEDLSSNDITKLDGLWNVNSNIVDTHTNKPLKLQYEFKNGKGTATITQKNGVKCTGNVSGGLKDGSLNIDSESVAKCTDGSSYALPKVKCTQGSDGNSDCTSTYDGGINSKKYDFPMTIHR